MNEKTTLADQPAVRSISLVCAKKKKKKRNAFSKGGHGNDVENG